MNDDLAAKREKAREAMETTDHKEARQLTEAELDLKRYRARISMESYDQKKRREAREKKIADDKAAAEKLAIDLQRQKKEAEEKEFAARRAVTEQQQAEADMKRARVEHMQASEALTTEIRQNKKVSLSAIRTLRSDVERAVTEEHMSLTQMAIQEQARKKLAEKRNQTNWWPLLIGLPILLLLVFGGYLFWQQSSLTIPVPTPQPKTPTLRSIIPAEEHREIKLETIAPGAAMREILKYKYEGGSAAITNLYFTKVDPNSQQHYSIGLRNMLGATGIELPPSILQFLNEDFMLGIGRAQVASTFLVVTTANFENAAYAFLGQEQLLAKAIYPLLAGTTLPDELTNRPFKDRTIKNVDTRILTDPQGRVVLLYSFLDRTTAIITDSEQGFMNLRDAFLTPDRPQP